jgi:hypothetical protein
MVVKYRPMRGLALGALPFRAALMCGEAAPEPDQPPTTADRAADAFLAKAEPPQHNDWTSRGTDLASEYRGGSAQIERFMEAVRAELKQIVAPPNDDTTQGPEDLRRLLALPGTAPIDRKAEVVRLEWRDPQYSTLAATIRVNFRKDREKTSLRPHVYIETDAGAGIELPFDLRADQAAVRVDGNAFTFAGGGRDATILLSPRWDEVPVRRDLSAVRVDVSVQHRRKEV